MTRKAIPTHILLSLSTAAAALVLPASAFAQDGDTGVAVDRDEIVVTAQKREENILDVPVSISVVGGEQLVEQGAASLADYAGYVPGMQISSAGTPGQSTVTLRGVAPLSGAQTVGMYLDDAPVGSSSIYNRAGAFSLDLLPYDIERVEVLRGPQGTLYGASSIGGLLKYVTVSPSTTRFSVRGGVEAFGIDGAGELGWAGNVMVNAPVVADKIGVSASFSMRRTPGYANSVNNPALDDQNSFEQVGGRVAVLFQPSEALSVKLSGIWQSIDADGNGIYAADLTGRRLGDGSSYNNFVAEPFTTDLEFYAGTIDYDFGGAVLTSATTWSRRTAVQDQDASYSFGVLFPLLTGGAVDPGITPFEIALGLDKFTQEFRLASPGGGMVEWLVGAFYTHEDSSNNQIVRSFDMDGAAIPGLDPLATIALPATYKEYALFGNATVRFSDRFHLSGGVRWARNEQTFRQISEGAIVAPADDPGASNEDVFTYSISPQFHLNDDAMLYARVASGYRPGGPNVIVLDVPPSVDSDSLTNYEVGFKADLAGRMVTIDVAAFYMDWRDIQVVRAFGGVSGNANGGRAVSKGFEGSLLLRPTRGLTVSLTGSYTDAHLSEDVPEISGADGDRLPAVPEFSGAMRIDYGFDLGGNLRGDVGAGLRHASGRLSSVESDPLAVEARPYTSVDLNAALSIGEHWKLRAYARNLFNNQGELSRALLTDGLGDPSFIQITPIQPRTLGVAFELSF
ncbi:TonB-dependent receptor [Sphingomonas suaedae]|uniref:TonB-dependent receptor n=1 Tax=Sphingomonas suaedae TaxID=2599297 RepID=A0A518RKF7_9SPHN|nr:TonB-dependent receptor [Sphingomonas suaedae]QDX27936.1 TonB-dependent receptor [Sphingomonas suaedae]